MYKINAVRLGVILGGLAILGTFALNWYDLYSPLLSSSLVSFLIFYIMAFQLEGTALEIKV